MRHRAVNRGHRDKRKGGSGRLLAGLALFILLLTAWKRDGEDGKTPFWKLFGEGLAGELTQELYVQYMPCVAQGAEESCAQWVTYTQMETILPLYGMVRDEKDTDSGTAAIREEDGHSRVLSCEELAESASFETTLQENLSDETKLQNLVWEENQLAWQSARAFIPHTQKMMRIDPEEYADYESLIGSFYTIDANTMAGRDQLDVEKLMSEDLSLQKGGEEPQILIYHTHSQEAFADSVPGDVNTSIVGVGERLAQILREEYGYTVLHHTGGYDVDGRDDAYGRALPALEQILKEHPSIQVVIDLHRDQMAEETRLVMDLDGRPTARFMFFNGLSRTKQSGDIDYLKNENIDGNLAFSFQMQLKCAEYYPGLTRKIYLKGYRYNMHLRSRSLLVELGAQNNTVEEAMNACDPLAHVLDMVLSKEE